MRNTRRFLVLVALIVIVPPVEASDVTLFGGVQQPGDITLSTAVEEGVNFVRKPANFGVFGIRSSQGTLIGGEHTFAFAPNFLDSDSKALFINSNVIAHAPLPTVRPYLTGGLGAVHSFGDGPGDIGTKFAVNYGGGLKIFLLGAAGVRLDVRGYTIPGVRSETLNVFEVSLGVVFSY
jgi:hypothetical protein